MTIPGEPFLLRTDGGPAAGTRVLNEHADDGWTWPLPDVLHIPGREAEGCYRKVQESQLPPMPRGGHVIRGAEYTWHPEGA